MKRAVLSDVHGNLEALDAVLRDIDCRNDRGAGIAELFCLGNVVGLGPNPRECLERIKQRCSRTLLGDHDRRMLEKIRKPLNPVEDLGPGGREGVLWAIHQLFGSDAGPGYDDSPTIELLGKVMAPDYEASLAEELSRRTEYATELHVPLAERMAGGESALTRALLRRMLTHSGLRGLVLQFMHRTRIRREADDWLRWLGSLSASARIDHARLVHDNPFTPGDGRPVLDAPPDPAKRFHPVSSLFSTLDWGNSTLLFFGHSPLAGVFRDPLKPGLLAASPGSMNAGAPEATYLLWDPDSESRVEVVRVPVGQAASTLEKMGSAGLPLPA